MTLGIDDLRFGVDDARRKHQAVVDQIAAGDRQALGFLQLYIALAVASLSGAAVILLSATNALPRPLGFGLASFGLTVALGAVCTLVVMWPSKIRLAGRDPNFWQWAARDDVTPDQAFRACLEQVAEDIGINRETNDRMGRAMLAAKCLGAAAPLLGTASGLIALLMKL
jgi:hypothetical protein